MVTVQIRWGGTEGTGDDRFNYVKTVITNLGCKPASPVESYDMYYLCGDVIINIAYSCGDLDVWVQGVGRDVFNFVIPTVAMIHDFISKRINDGEWSNDSYETRVSLELHETGTTCECKG